MQVQQAAKEEGLQAGTCRVDCIHTICTSVLSFCIVSIASLYYVIIRYRHIHVYACNHTCKITV